MQSRKERRERLTDHFWRHPVELLTGKQVRLVVHLNEWPDGVRAYAYTHRELGGDWTFRQPVAEPPLEHLAARARSTSTAAVTAPAAMMNGITKALSPAGA